MMFKSIKIPEQTPGLLAGIKDATSTLKESLTRFFDILKTQTEVAKTLMLESIHPNAVAINAICDQMITLLDDIDPICPVAVNFGLVSPFSWGVLPEFDRPSGQLMLPPKKNMNHVKDMLEARAEEETDTWDTFIGVISCDLPSLPAVLPTIQVAAEFFGIDELKALHSKLKFSLERGPNAKPVEVPKLDFKHRGSSCFLPELHDAANTIKSLMTGIKEATTQMGDTLDSVIKYFTTVEEQLTAIVNQWEKVGIKLEAGIDSEFFVWNYIPAGSKGATTLKELIADEANHPKSWSDHQFSAAFMMAGPEALSPMANLLGWS